MLDLMDNINYWMYFDRDCYYHKYFSGSNKVIKNMPSLSMFYGIIVYMYFMDNKQHKLPHIHVKYQDYEVIVSIPDGDVLEGNIPSQKMKILQAWIEIHKDELVANWELAISGEQPYKIEPLR